jgi:hypothetical protein
MDKTSVRVEGKFLSTLDDAPYRWMGFKAHYSLDFLRLLRAGNPTALMIVESQVEMAARALAEKDGIKADVAQIGVCPGALLIYDKHFPDHSTWWVMI